MYNMKNCTLHKNRAYETFHALHYLFSLLEVLGFRVKYEI